MQAALISKGLFRDRYSSFAPATRNLGIPESMQPRKLTLPVLIPDDAAINSSWCKSLFRPDATTPNQGKDAGSLQMRNPPQLNPDPTMAMLMAHPSNASQC